MLWPRMENVIQLKVTAIARLMDLLESFSRKAKKTSGKSNWTARESDVL